MDDWEAWYLACLERVVDTVGTIGAVAADRITIRACPQWTPRDLVGHLAGLAEDWVTTRLDGYASEAWTAAQIARHADQPLHDVLADWHVAGNRLVALDEHPTMGRPARWALGDALVHEADLYESIGSDQRPPLEPIVRHLGAAMARWSPTLANAGIALHVVTDTAQQWTIGAPDGDGITVSVDEYDCWRTIYGRRGRAATTNLRWSGDPTAIIALALPYPFHYPPD